MPSKECDDYLMDVIKARNIIIKKHGSKRGVHGEIECPVCKEGMLRYAIAKSNGHIHAVCTTEGCIRWIE